MADTTAIEWTDHTFNPWWGCARVSPACRFCYADGLARRYGHELWRRKGPRRMLSDANWAKPLKWNRDAERADVPAKVFCASMADVFEDHPQVVEARKRLWDLIEATPWLRWQLLTKRPENIAGMAPWGGAWPSNVWIGASVENQRYANERIPVLLEVPAAVHFLSCEPLVGPVDLTGHGWLPASENDPDPDAECLRCGTEEFSDDNGHEIIHYCGRDCPEEGCGREGGTTGEWCEGPLRPYRRISWVISGGESGPKARVMHPGWIRSLRDQCVAARVPYLFKQYGEWAPFGNPEWPLGDAWKNPGRHRWVSPSGETKSFGEFTAGDTDWAHMQRVGKKAAGRILDGQTWDSFPAEAVAP